MNGIFDKQMFVFAGNQLLPPDHPLRLGLSSQGNEDLNLTPFKRSGSERIKDGAKAILKRMESLKNKKKKKSNRDNIIISCPMVRAYYN